ncbi:MAG: hypothetical protein PHI71_06580 [Acidiphilium sp.]|nr:hypothetical protein [Acidiphilium sp.]
MSNVYSMMATGITVLTGFTFTALFSDHALASFGLPKSESENDRQDIMKLDILSQNFRARSAYFIMLSILEVVLLVAASFNFDIQPAMNSWPLESGLIKVASTQDWFLTVLKLTPILLVLIAFVINLIYLECLYTFYRMAETIIAILDTRRTYLVVNRENED